MRSADPPVAIALPSVLLALLSGTGCGTGGTNPSDGDDSLNVLAVNESEIVFADLTGKAFFLLRDDDGRRLFTQRGELRLSAENKIITTGGFFVQGFPVNEQFDLMPFSVQDLSIPVGDRTLNEPTLFVNVGGALSPKDIILGASVSEPVTVYLTDGSGRDLNVEFTLTALSSTQAVWTMILATPDGTSVIGTELFSFDADGEFLSTPRFTATLNEQEIRFDFAAVDGDRSKNSDLEIVSQDGFPLGTLTGFDVESDGEIIGTFDNDRQRTIGQFVLAVIANPETLVDEGDGVFSTGATTSNPILVTPSSQ